MNINKIYGNPTTTPINIQNFKGKASSINNKASGKGIHITDSSENKLNNLIIYGRTTQAAEPTLDAPQELVSIGAEPFNVLVAGNNLFNPKFISARGTEATDENSNTIIESGTTYDSSIGITAKCKDPTSGTSSYFYMVFESPYLEFYRDYTIIADVIVNNNYGSPTSSTYNQIWFRPTDGTNIDTAKVDVTSGKIAAYIPAENMLPSPTNPGNMWIQCLMQKKDITLKNIMLLPGDHRNNIPKYEDYKGQVLTIEAKKTLGNADNIAGLVGIPVKSGGNYTDESGQSWIANTIDFNKGKCYRRVIARRLPWTGWVWSHVDDDGDYIFRNETEWPYGGYSDVLNNYFSSLSISENSNGCVDILIKAPFVSTSELEEFITTNRPYVYYAHSSDSPTTLKTAELEQYKALTSYYPTTRVINSVDAHMEVEYVADTKNYIDNKIAGLTALVLEG